MKTLNIIIRTVFGLLAFFMLIMATSQGLKAQTVKQDSVLKDTVINKISYKLYVGARGGKYIFVLSKNGNLYKKYLKK